MATPVDTPDWSRIPPPVDDGRAAHLDGRRLPAVPLPSTRGGSVDLSTVRGRTVVYAYPRTGRPDADNPSGWDDIPGARGCTPQSCAFRDHAAERAARGVTGLYGLSTQESAYQAEAVARLHLPFPLLSDAALALAQALDLPIFHVAGLTLLNRLTLVIDDGTIRRVFYPVFPPDRNAQDVLDWLASVDSAASRPARDVKTIETTRVF